MSEVNNHIFETIDRQHRHESAHTRRGLIKTTTAASHGSASLSPAVRESAMPLPRTLPQPMTMQWSPRRFSERHSDFDWFRDLVPRRKT